MSTGPPNRRHILSQTYRTDNLSLQIFEFWSSSQTLGQSNTPTSPTALLHRLDTESSQLRILCALYESESSEGYAELESLMDCYTVPISVRTERQQSVTHSFGTQTLKDGSVELYWTHFLSRFLSTRVDEIAKPRVTSSSFFK